MKVVFLSLQGNIGQSLVAREVFYACMPPHTLYISAYKSASYMQKSFGINAKVIKEFSKYSLMEFLRLEDAILDVHISGYEDFIKLCSEQKELITLVDLFVITCVAEDDELIERVAVLGVILQKALSIEAHKIKIVLNHVLLGSEKNIRPRAHYIINRLMNSIENLDDSVSYDFNIFGLLHLKVVQQLEQEKLLSTEVFNNTTPYEKMILQEPENALIYAGEIVFKRLSLGFHEDCKKLFDTIQEM